jgi:SNF2 family DNA or RNA helicase
MTVLHGAWITATPDAPAAFAVWGEETAGRAQRRRRTLKPLAHHPPPHPFALTGDGVRHALSVLGLARWATPTNVRTAAALLPSLDGAPWRSTEPRPDGAALSFRPWDVPVVTLDPVSTVVFLPRLAAAAGASASGTVLGNDLRAWVVVARFALSLLARQRLRPGVRADGDVWSAAWSPVFDEPADRANLDALCASLPAAAAALSWTAQPDAPAARHVLTDYLATVTDAVARAAGRRGAPTPTRRGAAGAVDAWLAALGRPDPLIARRDEGAAAALLRQVAAWSQSGTAQDDGAGFRLCFRLVPPSNAGQPWRLEYLLQASDDPSLLVPLDEVWRQRGATAHFLSRRFDEPHERVLAGLGRASRLFPPLVASLRDARPAACELTTAQAADLVRDAALLLKASGFGVLLPGVDGRLNVRVRLRERGRNPAAGAAGPAGLGFDRLVAYDWQLALGDEPLTREEFELLARLKTPLVQLRGRWVDVRPDDIERALAFIRDHEHGAMPLGEALASALAPASLDGVPISRIEAGDWLAPLLEDLRGGASREPFRPPAGLDGELRPYQQRGVAWLTGLQRHSLGALLADDMGMGKTVQVIGLLLARRQAAGEARLPPTLVVCPTSVVGNWRREIARFAPGLTVHVHHGPDRARAEDLAAVAKDHDVVLSTYALLHRDEASLARLAWDGLVLDEAQNVKNPATRAARVARRLQAAWRVALTGTPVENRLADLWSIFEIVNPGYLGPAEQFRRRFALPIERAADADAAARLKALTAPFVLRRVKTDRAIIADLPDKQEMKVYCTLTREQGTLYEAVVREALGEIERAEGIERRGQVLALLTKLKQLCDHPALLLHDGSALRGRSGKLERLVEMLGEVMSVDERALVFSQYAEMGALLQRHLARTLDREVLFLHGGTPLAERDRMVARFQADLDGPPVLVLSLKAGGTGLNLTRANHVFHFDRWWNPAVENQATDRAFRIGQTRDVQVHKFLCAGTFEETLDELIERKIALAESIVGTGEAWITEMSPDELRELFSLREDAVAA